MDGFIATYGETYKTALGFFWKTGWAFVLGYSISAMIQTFVPKKRLTRHWPLGKSLQRHRAAIRHEPV